MALSGRRTLEGRLALAAAGLGVLALFAGGAAVLAQGGVGRPAYLSFVVAAALLVSSVILDPRRLPELARSRQARFGSLSVVVTAVVIGILALLNVLSARGVHEIDLTRAGLYTLSPQSVTVTRRLDSDLTATGFFRPDQGQQRRAAETLLALYQQQSPHVKVRFLDPDQNQAEAQRLGVDIAGSVVLEYRHKSPVVLSLASQSESDVTGALVRLESNRTPTVCWATGDGERDLGSQDSNNGYSTAAQQLKTSNYATRSLLLGSQARVPAGCDLVAVVGPTRPLSAAVQGSLESYVAGGGKLLLALGPWEDARTTTSVNAVIASWGVRFAGGLAVENDSNSRLQDDPLVSAATRFGDSPVTKGLDGKTVIFPHPTPITGTPPADVTSADLATTTSSSYEIVKAQQPRAQAAGDPGGPFTLMKTLQRDATGGRMARLVLVGTPEIADNQSLASGASNSELALNALDWLSQQENLIGISAKPAAAEPIPVTQQQLVINALVTLLLLPGLIAAAGVLVLLRRRAAPA